MLRDALLENIHRVQLNPLEEAAAYQQLLEEFERHPRGTGESARPVAAGDHQHDSAAKLPIPVQRRVAAGVLSAGHARALLSLDAGADAQEALAARIIAEGMSVRATEEAVTLANRGDDETAPRSPKRKPMQMPGLQDVAERLSDKLDTRVTVAWGSEKARLWSNSGLSTTSNASSRSSRKSENSPRNSSTGVCGQNVTVTKYGLRVQDGSETALGQEISSR